MKSKGFAIISPSKDDDERAKEFPELFGEPSSYPRVDFFGGITIERMRELAEADKDGRIVIMPKNEVE